MTRAGAFISTLVIAALGAAASLLVWHALASEQATEIERDASAIASNLANVIASRVEEQDLGALRRWAAAALAVDDAGEWRANAETFLADHPTFAAIARVENGAVTESAVTGDGGEILEAVAAKAGALLVPSDSTALPSEATAWPIRLGDGRVVLAIRVGAPGAGGRLTLAAFVPEVALRRALEQRARGFAIRALVGDEDVYRNADAERDTAEDALWSAETVRLSAGPDWSVRVHPTESVTGNARRKAPMVALIAGLLISALIASLVHVSQTSRARAAALAFANVDLRERIEATATGEAEIRRLNTVLEARVAERTAALKETIAELETFNYSVSHDLRSPLGAILNFTAILSQDYGQSLDDDGREYLRGIASSAGSVVSLMDGLLAFSRSGREELRKSHVDVQRLVETLRDEQLAARGAGSCTFHIGELPPAFADPAMLRLIFANLISNACKFVRAGESPVVEVGGKADGREVLYFVRDEGIGFDMRFAEKLFGVFERLHASDAFEGHGVGLAIVARLVRRHGGRTWAEGALGKGATFYIQLPLQDGRDDGRAFLYV